MTGPISNILSPTSDAFDVFNLPSSSLFTLMVSDSSYEPLFLPGELLTIDPTIYMPRPGEYVVVRSPEGMLELAQNASQEPNECQLKIFRPEHLKEKTPARSVQGRGLGVVVRRQTGGDGTRGWDLPILIQSRAARGNRFQLPWHDEGDDKHKPDGETDLFTRGDPGMDVCFAQAAEAEREGSGLISNAWCGISRSVGAARVFQDFAAETGTPENVSDLLTLATRCFVAGIFFRDAMTLGGAELPGVALERARERPKG